MNHRSRNKSAEILAGEGTVLAKTSRVVPASISCESGVMGTGATIGTVECQQLVWIFLFWFMTQSVKHLVWIWQDPYVLREISYLHYCLLLLRRRSNNQHSRYIIGVLGIGSGCDLDEMCYHASLGLPPPLVQIQESLFLLKMESLSQGY